MVLVTGRPEFPVHDLFAMDRSINTILVQPATCKSYL